MQALGSYILRLCCCAILAGIVYTLGGTGQGSRPRKMLCGLFIAFAVISPLREIDPWDFWELPETLYQDGQEIGAAAREDVNNAIRQGIIDRTQAYILDEAASLNAELQVMAIRLDPETLVPVSVTLSGDMPPYQRALLSDCIDTTLGIEKEEVVWME